MDEGRFKTLRADPVMELPQDAVIGWCMAIFTKTTQKDYGRNSELCEELSHMFLPLNDFRWIPRWSCNELLALPGRIGIPVSG